MEYASVTGSTNIAANVNTIRIALTEYQYSDAAACQIAANNYYLGLGNTGMAAPLSSSPLIYSFRKPSSWPNAAKEVRFTVGSANQVIDYHELKRKASLPTDNTNEAEIQAAIDELVAGGATVVTPKNSDTVAINGKKAWRVVLHAPPSTGSSKLALSGTFGLIINPPYP